MIIVFVDCFRLPRLRKNRLMSHALNRHPCEVIFSPSPLFDVFSHFVFIDPFFVEACYVFESLKQSFSSLRNHCYMLIVNRPFRWFSFTDEGEGPSNY